MKRLTAWIVAVVCILLPAANGFAAPPAQAGGQRQYVYSTSALNAGNRVELHLSPTGVRVVRRGLRAAARPDELRIRLGEEVVLRRALEWAEKPVDDGAYGYAVEVDLQKLGDGEYILDLESSAAERVEAPSGNPVGYRTDYTLASVAVVRQGGDWYFPEDSRLSSRYNAGLLQQLRQGMAPDDFAAIRRSCEKQENSGILAQIEAKAGALTAGLDSDLEKCLAINGWITRNIAYDFDFPRQNSDHWLQAHPEDAARLEDALNAFESGYAMCYGYAKLTTLMLGYAGVDSVYIRGRMEPGAGSAPDPGRISDSYSSAWNTGVPDAWSYRGPDGAELQDLWNHAWNAVKLSGSWYFLDTCSDAVYGYYRMDSERPDSGYVLLNRCYSGVYAFPSLARISDTHTAVRYGVEGYGKLLKVE